MAADPLADPVDISPADPLAHRQGGLNSTLNVPFPPLPPILYPLPPPQAVAASVSMRTRSGAAHQLASTRPSPAHARTTCASAAPPSPPRPSSHPLLMRSRSLQDIIPIKRPVLPQPCRALLTLRVLVPQPAIRDQRLVLHQLLALPPRCLLPLNNCWLDPGHHRHLRLPHRVGPRPPVALRPHPLIPHQHQRLDHGPRQSQSKILRIKHTVKLIQTYGQIQSQIQIQIAMELMLDGEYLDQSANRKKTAETKIPPQRQSQPKPRLMFRYYFFYRTIFLRKNAAPN